jgi:DsbC/DsbD-like thiol-disulfide interchange protein
MDRLLAISVCVAVLLSGCSHKVQQPPEHSEASLIVAQPTIAPGSQMELGIRFVLESGWHIYWQNPGDSGEPPRIQWKLPAEIRAGTLEWPTPTRLTTPAGTDYGYESTTVLLSSMQVPATAQPGNTIELVGDLRWLVCHDVCVPRRTQLKAPVRIANETRVDQSAQRLLQSAAARVPQPLPASFRPVATRLPDGFRLSMLLSEPVSQAQMFPSELEQIDNNAPQEFANHGGKMSLTLKKSEYLRQEPDRLRGVIVLNGQDAYQLDVPIHSLEARKGERHK